MEWKNANINEQGFLKVPNRWLHVHYYEALNILFRFENSLRVFVYVILKNNFFEKWKECNFTMSGKDASSIQSITSKRISQADSFGYLGFDIRAPMMHLTSGELVEIIISEAYWKHFKQYFMGNKDIIKNKLHEIGAIRNSLAHFRPIKAEDIELIKQNTRHTLLGVERCLNNVFIHNIRVPTNTSDQWYKSLSVLGTDYITTTPYHSSDECWVNVRLRFTSPTFNKESFWQNHYQFKLAKFNTSNILNFHNALTKNVTCLTESINYPILTQELDIKVMKDLNFVFKKSVLEQNYEIIAQEFTDILTKVTQECDLLNQDNLARGQLVETAVISTWWQNEEEGKKGEWKFNYNNLWQPYRPDHPDEYWGQLQYTNDVVAACNRYPWMPEDISSLNSFFD